MLRTLVFSFATLAWISGACAAEAASPTVNCNDVGSKESRPQSGSAAVSASGEDTAAEIELLEAANKSRELAGVPPFRMEETLREAARTHARRMVERDQLEHQFSGEPSLLERIAQVSPLKMDR